MGVYTDLIREARELHPDIAGVSETETAEGQCRISRIAVETEEAARALDKPVGVYVTLESAALIDGLEPDMEDTVKALTGELSRLLPEKPAAKLLVVGLGNRNVTPDALGPRTADGVFVTRHIRAHLPEVAPEGMREVAVFQPGVLGTTGVETVEIIRGLVDTVQPDALLCIDALAARRAERIASSIQLNNSGIRPGSGIGNTRDGLTQHALGIPVVAMGVPLVVYASTVVADVVSALAERSDAEGAAALEPKIREIVNERYGPMIVTPKEIDTLLHRASALLSRSINRALHAGYYDEVHALCN